MTARGKGPPLKARQHRFAIEYCKDLDGTAAARRAGYAARSARFRASKLLANVAVAAAVNEALAASLSKAMLEVERVDEQLVRACFADVRRLFHDDGTVMPPREWDADIAAAVAGFEVHERRIAGRNGKRRSIVRVVKVRLVDRVASLGLACRRLGLLTDSMRVSGRVGLEELVRESMKPRLEEPT